MKQLFLVSYLLLAGCSQAANQAEAASQAAEKPAVPASKIASEPLGGGFHMLTGPGGNIGLSIGEDGVFMVDDKYANVSEDILASIAGLTDQPLRYVLNTHYHGDHTGANAQMKAAGATILAHDNVRKRMGMTFENKTFGRTTEATDPALWPVLTFSDQATLHFNGQAATAYFQPGAHTDGDSIVIFTPANVVHMGDTFFNGLFPVVDISAGGTLQGMIAAHDWALARTDANTRIIPGHGPMATKADLQKTRDALATVLDRVRTARDSGMDIDTAVSSVDLTDYASFSWFIDEAAVIKAAYWSLEVE